MTAIPSHRRANAENGDGCESSSLAVPGLLAKADFPPLLPPKIDGLLLLLLPPPKIDGLLLLLPPPLPKALPPLPLPQPPPNGDDEALADAARAPNPPAAPPPVLLPKAEAVPNTGPVLPVVEAAARAPKPPVVPNADVVPKTGPAVEALVVVLPKADISPLPNDTLLLPPPLEPKPPPRGDGLPKEGALLPLPLPEVELEPPNAEGVPKTGAVVPVGAATLVPEPPPSAEVCPKAVAAPNPPVVLPPKIAPPLEVDAPDPKAPPPPPNIVDPPIPKGVVAAGLPSVGASPEPTEGRSVPAASISPQEDITTSRIGLEVFGSVSTRLSSSRKFIPSSTSPNTTCLPLR